MKRYIRTKDGKIFDTKTSNETIFKIKNKNFKDEEPCWLSQSLIDDHYFLIDRHNCVVFSYKRALETIEELKKLGYKGVENLVICIDFECKQANTIEDLIMVGDLVGTNYQLKKPAIHEYDFYTNLDYACELYTKQGRNYVLVAEKVNGEWRVL